VLNNAIHTYSLVLYILLYGLKRYINVTIITIVTLVYFCQRRMSTMYLLLMYVSKRILASYPLPDGKQSTRQSVMMLCRL